MRLRLTERQHARANRLMHEVALELGISMPLDNAKRSRIRDHLDTLDGAAPRHGWSADDYRSALFAASNRNSTLDDAKSATEEAIEIVRAAVRHPWQALKAIAFFLVPAIVAVPAGLCLGFGGWELAATIITGALAAVVASMGPVWWVVYFFALIGVLRLVLPLKLAAGIVALAVASLVLSWAIVNVVCDVGAALKKRGGACISSRQNRPGLRVARKSSAMP